MQNTSGTALDLSTAAPVCAETATAAALLLDKDCSHDGSQQLELEASSIAIVPDDPEEHETEPGTPQHAVMTEDDVKLETGVQLDDEEAAPKEAVETFAERPCVESRGVVSVKWDVTRKNKASVVIDGYKMTESRSGKDGRVFWRCSKRFCPATAISVGSRLLSVRRVDAGRFHSHPPAGQEEFFAGHFLAPGTPTEVTVKWPVSRGLGGAGTAAAVRGSPAKRQRRLVSEGGLGGGGDGAPELPDAGQQQQQETKADPDDATGTPSEHRRLSNLHQHHQLYRRRHGQMQRPRFHGGQRRDRSGERHEQLAQPPPQQPQQPQQHPQFLLNATAGDPLDSATEDSPPPMKREAIGGGGGGGGGGGSGGGFVGSGLDCGRLGNPDFLSLLQAAAAYQQQLQQQLQQPAQLPAHLQRHFQGQSDPMLFAAAAPQPPPQQQPPPTLLQHQPPLLQQQSPLLQQQQQQQQQQQLMSSIASSSLSMPLTSSSLSMSLTSSAVEMLQQQQQQPIDNGQLVRQLRRLEAYFRAGIAGLSDAMCRVGTSADERESLGRLFSYMDGLGRVQRLAAELS